MLWVKEVVQLSNQKTLLEKYSLEDINIELSKTDLYYQNKKIILFFSSFIKSIEYNYEKTYIF